MMVEISFEERLELFLLSTALALVAELLIAKFLVGSRLEIMLVVA